ncbi:MAG: hypothetical protein C4540_06285 [Candidatus Omnitrophota bacterium]|jgi:hypothetical protein|nr:MAG: hypothetical protein C4540_06285 [Candidatus Omnitrophota bacterium]
MFVILSFTILGFISGLAWVMYKRKLKPGKLLTVTFFGILALGVKKILREYFRHTGKGGGKWGF